jgi:hypothetical protein
MAETTPPPLPDFLIIGAQKSATRWLRVNLGLHPEVFTADAELSFFDRPGKIDALGLDWYRHQFDGWSGERLVGEATPGYMMWRHDPARIADRIQELLPDVRLLAVLRNPVDRARSGLVHHIKHQRVAPDARLMDMVRRVPPTEDPLGLVSGGWYAASLRPYVRRFGDRLLVLLHDDVSTDPAGVFKQAAGHIGADPSFLPPELAEVRFSNQGETPGGERTGGSGRSRPRKGALTDDERVELYAYFRRDVAQLERMIGRDLSHWDPEHAAVATAEATA